MQENSQQKNNTSNKKGPFNFFTEVIGWLQIFISPFVIGSIIGALVYFPRPSTAKLVIAITIATTGLCIGITWATRVWRKTGTTQFMSGIIATPELDTRDEDQK